MKQIFNLNELESIGNSCIEEKETTVSVLGSENTMDVYTSDNAMLTKLKKIWASTPNTIECYEMGRCEGKVTGYLFKMDKRHLSFRAIVGREVSEEFKKAASERFKKLAAEGKLGRK